MDVQKYPKMWKYVLRATSRQSLTCAKKILSGDIFMQDRCLLYFAERVTGEVVSIIWEMDFLLSAVEIY